MNEIDDNMCYMGVRGLAGKEHDLILRFNEENLDIVGIIETKKKGNGGIKLGHLFIYNGVSVNSRAKEGVGCIINKKYITTIKNWEGISERILKLQLHLKTDATILIVCEPNEDEQVLEKEKFWKTLNEAMDEVDGRLIIIGDLNGRVGKRDEEGNDVIGMN